MHRREKILLAILTGAGVLYLLSRTSVGQTTTSALADKIGKFIVGHEADKLTAYQDEAGIWTIGKGHKILPTDTIRGSKLHPYGALKTITQAESDALYAKDVNPARLAVARLVTVPITENQRVALISLVFNIGEGAFAGSTLLRLLNAGDYAGAAAEFPKWNKVTVSGVKKVSAGLTTRRASEQSLFNA